MSRPGSGKGDIQRNRRVETRVASPVRLEKARRNGIAFPCTMRPRRKLCTVKTFYGLVRRELSSDRLLLVSFMLAATLYAAGHATTSIVAGMLAKMLLIGDVEPLAWGPISLTLVGLGSGFVKGGSAVWTATSKTRMAHRVGNFVRGGITKRLLRSGPEASSPQVMARIALRVREVERAVDEGFLAFGQSVAQLIPLAGALIVLSPPLALGSTLFLVPFAFALASARRLWRSGHAGAMQLAERLHREMDDLVRHMDVWRAYGAGQKVETELVDLGEQAGRVSARVEGGRAALSAGNEILAALALLLVIVAAPLAGSAGLTLSGESLVPFATVLFMTYKPLRDLGDARSAMTRGAIALEALEELAAPVEVEEPASSPKARTFALATLTVEGLGAARDGMPRTSFVAAPGEVVAIVGPTGSGKTTLLRALLGLEPHVVGSIRYADEELTSAAVGPFSRPFAWVPQEAPILTGTLAENILLDRDDREASLAALSSMGASKLARDCGDELLGAGGRPLSGGERRLVGLARAIALGAPVLLLDEPTEGLDELSQARVLAALEKLRVHRTVVLVTHRPEPLRIADRVVRIGALTSRETTSRLP